MIVLKTVSYIFPGVAMMRLEPAMKIEIIIYFSRCLIQANVHIYLMPKETLHYELPNISLLYLSLAELNIAVSCWYPPPTQFTKNRLGKLIFFRVICSFNKITKSAFPNKIQSKPRI